MSLSRGPVRIVLIRSGGYDYADLELHEPVHLVAANNVGKTTLIAALQFLYIDDLRQMHFSHDWGETRRHYFPHAGSIMLFECMTPTGLRVLGLHGMGPVQGFEYERFTYAGEYNRSDYLDGRMARPWEDIRRRLIGRGLAFMEPRHLKASLTGSGEAIGPPLGLVPLKRSGSYESFRFLLRNLLRLSRIEQEQLKTLFIDIMGNRLRKERVDLRRDYAELFAKVTRDSEDVAVLQRMAPSISELVVLYGQRDLLRGRLARLWQKIERGLAEEQAGTLEGLAALAGERGDLAKENERIDLEQARVRGRISNSEQARGALREELLKMERLGESVRGFVPAIEAAIRSEISERQDALVARIAEATRSDLGDIEGRLAEVQECLARDRRLVEQFHAALVTWLRDKSSLSDAELDDVFRIVNPSILGQVVGGGAVQISDSGELIRVLRAVHSAFSADGFEGAGVAIHRRALPSSDPLRPYHNVEVIRQRITKAIADESVLKGLLIDIGAREALVREREQVRRELIVAEGRLRDWTVWREYEPRVPAQRAQLERHDVEIQQGEDAIAGMNRRLTQVALRVAAIETAESGLRKAIQARIADVRRLQPPQPDWEPEPDAVSAVALDELVRQYTVDMSEQKRKADRFAQVDADVENKTAGRHKAATEKETIRQLEDELAALENRQRSLQDLWTSLVDGMRNDFKALVEGVDEIRREVSRLTQALSARRVSNLERVELELVKQADLIGRLEAVIRAEAAPLFAGPEGKSRAAADIASWLKDKPVIELMELFNLRFKVVDRIGHTKTFDSLTQIESQGTSTTIKVLVHLELLRTMLADEGIAVPFFLDEVATLDDRNLRGLIEHATEMGFVPIVASPEARDTVRTLYFLRPSAGGLVLDETSRVVLRREQPHGA